MTSSVPATAKALMPKTQAVVFNTLFDATNLKGKSIFITGGALGIGATVVTALAGTGALMTIADQLPRGWVSRSQNLNSQGFNVQFLQTDIPSYESQATAFQLAVTFGGGNFDLVVPSAGIIAEKTCSTWP